MQNKRQDIIQFSSILILIILVNIIASLAHFRIDLTKEGRYSLSEATQELVKNLDDYIYIEIYLEGEFPGGVERLSLETKQILSEFKSLNKLIQYTFINPTESADEKTRNEILQQLYEKGLNPTSLQVKDGDGYSEKVIVPGAIVKYGAQEVAINLLKNQITAGPQENIEHSIRELEYEFTNAINKLRNPTKPRVALISGHGELEGVDIEDFQNQLAERYSLSNLNLREFEVDSSNNPDLNKKLRELKLQKLLIIAKPRNTFQNLDKYFLDQYIMQGGKVLWMLDATNADMDSLSNKGSFLAHPLRDLNLNDQLFKYGARVNSNLVEDISSSKIPVPVSFVNDVPKWELRPWRYFPVAIPTLMHPITSNLNAVKFDFASSIDTVNSNPNIKKTVLLHSSPYTKLANTPYEVSLQGTLDQPVQDEFNYGEQALAVLLEGEFESIFKNRLTQISSNLPFTETSKETKMIVISDGDIAKNKVSRGDALPLGYDNYEKRQYANKDFLLNCVDYLLEEDALIDIRNRDIKMRLLDMQKINEERSFWQIINILIPVSLILLFGLIKYKQRKNKYANEK